MEHDGNDNTNDNCCVWNDFQRLCKGAGRFGNRLTSREHKAILRSAWKTKKSPEDLRMFVVTQTPVKDHQLTLV